MSKPGGRSAHRSAISTSSASLSAVQSLVLTTIGMDIVYWLDSLRSQPLGTLARRPQRPARTYHPSSEGNS